MAEASDADLAKWAREAGDCIMCHAGSDGDCFWRSCPQQRDGEPKKSGRHCPLDKLFNAFTEEG